jgi:hypothetical protein
MNVVARLLATGIRRSRAPTPFIEAATLAEDASLGRQGEKLLAALPRAKLERRCRNPTGRATRWR